MKIIKSFKIFESVGSNEYYEVVDNDTYLSMLTSKKNTFSKKYVSSIYNFMKNIDMRMKIIINSNRNKKTYYLKQFVEEIGTFNMKVDWCCMSFLSKRFTIHINLFEDDYFLVSLLDVNNQPSVNGNRLRDSYTESYYKCDQLDGLFYILKRDVIDEIELESFTSGIIEKQSSINESSHNYYREISRLEFSKKVGFDPEDGNNHPDNLNFINYNNIKILPISISNYLKVYKLLDNHLIKSNTYNYRYGKSKLSVRKETSEVVNSIKVFTNTGSQVYCNIYLTEDEWYMIDLEIDCDFFFYECDQIEGLIKCLETIL